VKELDTQKRAGVPAPDASHGGPEILLVEDNPLDAELTLQALREAGFSNKVEHVRDGEEALEMIFEPKTTPALPKLVLLDLNLGKMGGLHVLRRLKSDERTKGIPVVVLSASKMAIEVIESYKLGVNSYVMKPGDGKKFGEIVRTLGHYWLAINEAPSL
jgi:two-component system, response regulator